MATAVPFSGTETAAALVITGVLSLTGVMLTLLGLGLVMTGAGRLIEVQMSAEGAAFTRAQMGELLDLAEAGIAGLVEAQRAAVA